MRASKFDGLLGLLYAIFRALAREADEEKDEMLIPLLDCVVNI